VVTKLIQRHPFLLSEMLSKSQKGCLA